MESADKSPYQAEREDLARKVGAKLRASRDAARISQDEMAAVSGIHRTEISALERGGRIPNLLTLLIWADALGTNIDQLAKGLKAPKHRRRQPPR